MVAGVCGLGLVTCGGCLALVAMQDDGPARPSAARTTGNEAAAPSGSLAGHYVLAEANGKKVPAGAAHHLFVDGTLDIDANGKYAMRLGWQGELGNARTSGEDGTVSGSGDALTFTRAEGAAFSGSGDDDGIEVNYDFDSDGEPEQFRFERP